MDKRHCNRSYLLSTASGNVSPHFTEECLIQRLKIEKLHIPNLSNSSTVSELLLIVWLSFLPFFPKHIDPSSFEGIMIFTQCHYFSLLTFNRAILGGLEINEYPIFQFPVQSVHSVLEGVVYTVFKAVF